MFLACTSCGLIALYDKARFGLGLGLCSRLGSKLDLGLGLVRGS